MGGGGTNILCMGVGYIYIMGRGGHNKMNGWWIQYMYGGVG